MSDQEEKETCLSDERKQPKDDARQKRGEWGDGTHRGMQLMKRSGVKLDFPFGDDNSINFLRKSL